MDVARITLSDRCCKIKCVYIITAYLQYCCDGACDEMRMEKDR